MNAMKLFPAPLLRQDRIVDSRDVAAEWGDGLLDADEDTKRVSRQRSAVLNPPIDGCSSEAERCRIPASVFAALMRREQIRRLSTVNKIQCPCGAYRHEALWCERTNCFWNTKSGREEKPDRSESATESSQRSDRSRQ